MTSALDTPAFLIIWICFPLLMCGMLIVFFLWGVRAGQFADQERARYLALDSGIPEDQAPATGAKTLKPPSRPPPSGGRSQAGYGDSEAGDFRFIVPSPGGGGQGRGKLNMPRDRG
ncbi:cbb3-type cytochrome oxidase assembly protein CcoS [Geomonas anaerohicana]|uniref:Cbb3-type cytochrome oxidase assembly protein CcoS n=1 Tax=Geomonas anaerohicana TaxID=2798583 RepID=A0ABS0Y8W8_9BACT|nr:cbb3-type cytochrome oxidase assembly protein CcoS [Geomonas anaerohicana]MBJ6748751.1 cbb3-type cytochrome oxidase assembly protein CcoS [Geomonas anaerohicana]